VSGEHGRARGHGLDLRVQTDVAALAEEAASAIADVLTAAVAARGEASLVLTGGTTPAKIYRALATREVPWEHVSFYFGDERAVPPTDPESNFKMAHESLLSLLPREPKLVERMRGEAEDLEAEADRYASALPDEATLLLLGVGEDGHVCSLFPGHPEAAETARRVVVVRDSPKPPPVRLSITPVVIARAERLFVLAAGAAKRDALFAAFATTDSSLPVALARRGSFFLDATAASRLLSLESGTTS